MENAWANQKLPFSEWSNDVDVHTFSIEHDEPLCELPFGWQGWNNLLTIFVQAAVLEMQEM